MEKPTILARELHLTSLREKYMSDPDIIPPSGTTKQEYVDQMVSQLERQNRNNSRAYSLLTPTASDTAEGGGSDMYVQINRIKKAAKMLQKSYDEEDYMQAIKLSMQQHSDDYSFLKAKEKEPPQYKIVHRYSTRRAENKETGKDAGDKRAFIVVDSDTLDAPVTLTRSVPHSTAKSASSRSWVPVYGYATPYPYGNSEYNSIRFEHVQQLEDSILNDDESRQRHAASGVSSTQDAFDTIFADWKDDRNIFPPKSSTGKHDHKNGLQKFIREAVDNEESPKRDAYNQWMDHVKSLGRLTPRLDAKSSIGKSDYTEFFRGSKENPSEWKLAAGITKVIYQSHHKWLSEGQPDSDTLSHFNFPSLQTMKVEGAGRSFMKADSPEGLLNKEITPDSGLGASLLPLMRVIHDINEDSDIENSPVWQADATGVESGSALDEGDYETHEFESFMPENIDMINAVHQSAINDRIEEGTISQEKADNHLLNQPAFLDRLKVSINTGNVVDGLSSILADKTGVHETPQSFGSILVNAVKGERPKTGFNHPNVPSEDENSVDSPEVPQAITDYFNGGLGKPPMSREQFDSLSPLRQHIMIDRMISVSEAAKTPQDFHDAVEGLSDDLHKTKSDTYLSSDDLLSDNSPYKDNIAKVEEQFSINLTSPSDDDVDSDAEAAAEANRVEQERVEANRVEAERVEAERVEAERVEAERVEAERLEQEKAEAAAAEKADQQRQQLNMDSDGALNELSEEDSQAVFEASKNMSDEQRATLTEVLQTRDSDKLNQFIADPSTPLDTTDDSDKIVAPVEQNAPEAGQDAPEVEEDSERGLNELEQQALDNLNDITNNAANNLSPELQRDVAQAAVSIQRTTIKQIADARKNAEEKNTDLTANQIEGFERGEDSSVASLAKLIEDGKESIINEAVQKFRGTRESYENATERTADQGGARGPDGGGARESVVSETQGDAGQSGDDEGAGEEVTDENVDGDTVGGSVSDEVDDSDRRSPGEGLPPSDNGEQGRLFDDADTTQQQEQQQQDETEQDETEQESGGDAPEEESDEIKHRRERIAKLGDDALGALVDEDEFGYHNPDAVRASLLDPDTNTAKQFSAHMKRASETHAKNEDKSRRTSSKSNRALRDSIRRKKGLLDVVREHIKDHVATHDGRAFHDLKYKDLGSYARYLNSLSDDDRRKELEDHQKTAATRAEEKEKEEAKAAETAETEANKEKAEEDKAAWATESQRVQEQMAAMPSLLGPDGKKIADKWDNTQSIHYFRNLHKIVFHETRVNLKKAGVDTSHIKDLSGLLRALGDGDALPTDIKSKISNSAMAINSVLTPRQKRELSEEMQNEKDYMGDDHRKKLAVENEKARNNEEDYQKRGAEVVSKGSFHPIFGGTSEENYRDKDGKITPLYSDSEDMQKKDEDDARIREEGSLGEESQSEKAKRRVSQGHPPTESPGEGYAYHPESGQWVDRERFDTMTSHFDEHLKPGETASFSPSNTLHTEHVGKGADGKRSVVLQAHEPLSVRSKGASDYISVTKNKKGQLIWSPVKPPEQNKHGFISPDVTHHDTGNPELDERLNNAHAVGQIKGTFHTQEHEEGSGGDYARHGMQYNIVRHHNLAGKAAPKNTLQIGNKINEVLSTENFSNIAGNILNFSRKHGGSLATKLKLPEEAQKGLDEFRSDPSIAQAEQKIGQASQNVGETAQKVGGAAKAALPDIARLFYDPRAQPKLYAKWAAAAAKAGTTAILGTGTAPEDLPKGKLKRGISRIANIVPSEVSEAVGAAKDKVSDVVRGGLYEGNEKLNQATVAAADKAGKVIDRTKEGASQVGQDIASAGMASVDTDQPPSAVDVGRRQTPEAIAGQRAKYEAQFGPEQEAPEGETEAEATKRLTPADGTRDEDGNLMDRTARREAGRVAAKTERRQPEPEPEKPVGEDKPGVAERAAMGAAGAVDTTTEKLRGIGSALQSRKDSMPSDTDKVEVEQDPARFGSDAPTGGKKMDRAARRRQTKDIQSKTGSSSKDVQLVHPEPDTPVGKLQGFVGSVHRGREHRVDTDTSVAARPITPTPEDTSVTPDNTPDTSDQQGLSRAERRKQRFGSKPGASGGSTSLPSSSPSTQASPQKPADTSFKT